MKLKCKRCKKPIIIKDGSFDRPRKFVCEKCGEKILITKKKNGKVVTV